MINITLKLPRDKGYYRYVGNAENFVNLPIMIDGQVIGVITKIKKDTEHYIEVEGTLRSVVVNYYERFQYPPVQEIDYDPMDVEIILK